jgi:hypothetical protein
MHGCMHYSGDDILAPVTIATKIKISLFVMALIDLNMEVIDVQEAFLVGFFSDEEVLCMKLPQEFGMKYKNT